MDDINRSSTLNQFCTANSDSSTRQHTVIFVCAPHQHTVRLHYLRPHSVQITFVPYSSRQCSSSATGVQPFSVFGCTSWKYNQPFENTTVGLAVAVVHEGLPKSSGWFVPLLEQLALGLRREHTVANMHIVYKQLSNCT